MEDLQEEPETKQSNEKTWIEETPAHQTAQPGVTGRLLTRSLVGAKVQAEEEEEETQEHPDGALGQ
ncbi:Hypothetical protein FKW44_014751 [Caligus rogercresseyi]|uniref:Uncharacterized protein n=1 Tax=Caligus rogercresseyi TaxID=217165 RepID=A0A7T8GZF7_CALRO|nr:Hypothetical protein FKW44_014751 [Caligus rogercresseyi]